MKVSAIVYVEEARNMWKLLCHMEDKMQNDMSATEVLVYLKTLLELNLSELVSAEHKNQYVLGSWEADIECLEVISSWERAKEFGLDYNPEIKFKLK